MNSIELPCFLVIWDGISFLKERNENKSIGTCNKINIW